VESTIFAAVCVDCIAAAAAKSIAACRMLILDSFYLIFRLVAFLLGLVMIFF
jgi:hypothetical protein